MKIHILCGSGSTDGVTLSDLHGVNGRIGVGGSEYALLTMCEGWKNSGHEVVLYNNPKKNDGDLDQRSTESFEAGEKRDVLIIFREPTSKAYRAEGLRIFWSCDQFTVGDFRHFSQFANKIVTISPYHSEYFKATYGIENCIDIDLPVRTWEYENSVEKVPNRLIFTSVPDRGLEAVLKTYPRIREAVPDVSLTITSDYRLWGAISPLNDQWIQKFMRLEGVRFLGGISRKKLIEEQLKAQIHYYPCIYPELFCIAVAESQVAGVLPIATPIGALGTTNMGVVIDGDANQPYVHDVFVEKTVEYLQKASLPEIQKKLQAKARKRFSLERILKEWEEKVLT